MVVQYASPCMLAIMSHRGVSKCTNCHTLVHNSSLSLHHTHSPHTQARHVIMPDFYACYSHVMVLSRPCSICEDLVHLISLRMQWVLAAGCKSIFYFTDIYSNFSVSTATGCDHLSDLIHKVYKSREHYHYQLTGHLLRALR